MVELAAKRSGLAVEDGRANVPEELSVWIDPFEVSPTRLVRRGL